MVAALTRDAAPVSGVRLIAAERKRQRSRRPGGEFYSLAHDDEHDKGEIARAVRRLGGRYANVLMVYSPEHNAHWWAIEDELFYDREACK